MRRLPPISTRTYTLCLYTTLVRSAGEEERLRYTYWLHYAEGSAMMPLLLGLVFRRLPQGPMPFFLRPLVRRISAQVIQRYVSPQIAVHLDYLETQLNAAPWRSAERRVGKAGVSTCSTRGAPG